MSIELILSGVAALGTLITIIVTIWKARNDRRKERNAEDAAMFKAPAEVQSLIFAAGIEGSEKALMLLKQAAEAARQEADRKATENEKLLYRIAALEEEVRKRDEKIETLQDKVRDMQTHMYQMQKELDSLTEDLQHLVEDSVSGEA